MQKDSRGPAASFDWPVKRGLPGFSYADLSKNERGTNSSIQIIIAANYHKHNVEIGRFLL
jgi:hypothetical protein